MSMRVVFRALISAFFLGCLGLGLPRSFAQDGIYADFTTSMGNFTCVLSHTFIPTNVANFIGLATGQRSWLDLTTGKVRTNAFYNGLTFHRVMEGFMIQAGSPNGKGTDGPGYVVRDEINPYMHHNTNGIVAIANAGLPHTGGSQFYITVTNNATWLDGDYTIMGRVTSGMDVVNAISRVATDTNDVPLTNVVIQSVAIRRVGTAAQNFDINAQHLPMVSAIPLRITNGNQEVTLSFSNSPYAHDRLFESTNLTGNWSYSDLPIFDSAPMSNTVRRAADSATGFYRISRVQYPSSTFAPPTLAGRTLRLTYTTGGSGTAQITFDNAGSGTYTDTEQNTGTVTYYDWYQDIYRGYLWPIQFSDWWPMYARFEFTSNTGGTFSGQVYILVMWFDVAGTFTLTP